MRSAIVRTDRYSRGAIAFHWTIAALVLFNIIVGLFHESLLRGTHLMPAHKALGILILVLSVGRLGWRLANPAPPLPASIAPWERAASHITHWLFYALIILMPLSGWAMVSVGRRGGPVDFFGLFNIPALPVSMGVGRVGDQFHAIAGYLFAALVVVHIAAALRHHFILRDNILRRMTSGATTNG